MSFIRFVLSLVIIVGLSVACDSEFEAGGQKFTGSDDAAQDSRDFSPGSPYYAKTGSDPEEPTQFGDGKPEDPMENPNGNPADPDPIDGGNGSGNNVCKYFVSENRGKPVMKVLMPVPDAVHPQYPIPQAPLVLAARIGGAEAIAIALLMSNVPTVDISPYTLDNKGSWVQNEYRFTFEAFRLPTGWALNTRPAGLVIGEVTYNVVIKNARTSDCQAIATAQPVTRGDIVGNPNGCFDPHTKIKMADGQSLEIRHIKVGDQVWNPQLAKTQAVKTVTYGPELKPMITLQTKHAAVSLTSLHPVILEGGVVIAAEKVKAGDIVIGVNGRKEAVEKIATSFVEGQMVYNLELDNAGADVESHIILANELYMGDHYLQRQLATPLVAVDPWALVR